MFSGSQNIVINNGQFVDQQTSTSGIDILLEASTPDAAHDSSIRDHRPQCSPGTREQYIEDIIRWAVPAVDENPPPLFWMTGPAGVGKSAVAQTCAEMLKSRGKLGAAFFFSVNERNKPIHFFTTIAYQLTTISHDYHDIVDRKIRRDKTLVNKSLESQFLGLIVEPLQELEREGKGIRAPMAIIVDGLDECEGVEPQCRIIEIITAAARDGITPFRWAFFSRSESHIEAIFAKADVTAICHRTVLPVSRDADGDIELYLRNGFDHILQRRNIQMETLWPTDDNIKILVDAAGGLFIYAATVLRFIAQPGSLGVEGPLQVVLDVILDRKNKSSSSSQQSPFSALDAFYALIIERIPKGMIPQVCLLFGVVQALGSLSVAVISNLLRLSKLEFKVLCNQLNAVLLVEETAPPFDPSGYIDPSHSFHQMEHAGAADLLAYSVSFQQDGRVGFYHKSFRDFLVDPARSISPFFALGDILYSHLLQLRFDYESSYSVQGSGLILAPGVPDSASSLSNPSENEVTNSAIKAVVYDYAVSTCDSVERFAILNSKLHQRSGDSDFAKRLRIRASLCRGPQVSIRTFFYCGEAGYARTVRGTILYRTAPSDFSSFHIELFKKTIKRSEEAGVMCPHRPSIAFRFKSLFSSKNSPGKIESGLYRVGRGSRSVFWFWEINYERQVVQMFETLNLVDGMKIYREERMDSWFDEEGRLLK